MNALNLTHRARQRGVAAVEFALVSIVFFTLLIGILEFSRLLFYWNTVAEATRLGARMAVVCDANASIIATRMRSLLPLLQTNNIQLSYSPSNCAPDAATARSQCESVTVSVVNVSVRTVIPLVPLTLTVPPFTTTLSRESMNTSTGGSVCN